MWYFFGGEFHFHCSDIKRRRQPTTPRTTSTRHLHAGTSALIGSIDQIIPGINCVESTWAILHYLLTLKSLLWSSLLIWVVKVSVFFWSYLLVKNGERRSSRRSHKTVGRDMSLRAFVSGMNDVVVWRKVVPSYCFRGEEVLEWKRSNGCVWYFVHEIWISALSGSPNSTDWGTNDGIHHMIITSVRQFIY
jgi:hypothetical protein